MGKNSMFSCVEVGKGGEPEPNFFHHRYKIDKSWCSLHYPLKTNNFLKTNMLHSNHLVDNSEFD